MTHFSPVFPSLAWLQTTACCSLSLVSFGSQRSRNYFLDDVNFERIDDNILFIGFTSGFNSIKESCPSKTFGELDKLACSTFFLVLSLSFRFTVNIGSFTCFLISDLSNDSLFKDFLLVQQSKKNIQILKK